MQVASKWLSDPSCSAWSNSYPALLQHDFLKIRPCYSIRRQSRLSCLDWSFASIWFLTRILPAPFGTDSFIWYRGCNPYYRTVFRMIFRTVCRYMAPQTSLGEGMSSLYRCPIKKKLMTHLSITQRKTSIHFTVWRSMVVHTVGWVRITSHQRYQS